jgi:hypothetical protein
MKQNHREQQVVLYPRSERNKEQKELKEQARLEKWEKRPYHVEYSINRGYGTDKFKGWYRTEFGARVAAFFLTWGSKPNLTKVVLIKRH